VKTKQAGSQEIRSERLFFKSGAPAISAAFERIWADTPCRRPIQAVAFLSFRIVHDRRNLNAFDDVIATIRRGPIGVRRKSDR